MNDQQVRYRVFIAAIALGGAMAVSGCGGGGSADVVVVGRVSVPRLDIALSRPGPGAVQVDWSDDPVADSFAVNRNGFVLVDGVRTTSLIDASVGFNLQYCYRVVGYDRVGQVVSASEDACIAG